MPVRFAAVALAAFALLGASCSAGAPAPGDPATASSAPGSATPASGTPASAAPDPAADLPADAVGRAHQAALGLVALGTLGAEKGTTDAVRSLGERVTTDGRAVDDRVRAVATGSGIALGDDLGGPAQALLADVGARTGETFDQGWLRAVLELEQQARDGADAVLASGASTDAKAGARDVIARLDALAGALRGTVGAGAVITPTAVPAGSGGQVAALGPAPPVDVAASAVAPGAVPAYAPGVGPAASAPVGPGAVAASDAVGRALSPPSHRSAQAPSR